MVAMSFLEQDALQVRVTAGAEDEGGVDRVGLICRRFMYFSGRLVGSRLGYHYDGPPIHSHMQE